MKLKDHILDLSRQNNIGPLSPYFDKQLDQQIEAGRMLPTDTLEKVRDNIVNVLTKYREQTGRETVVLGMSGGVDSALTAALFKAAGWRVIGYTLPINQNHAETERGEEACHALGIEHGHKDLTDAYVTMLADFADHDPQMNDPDNMDHTVKIRRGNVRARTRMMFLYNMASFHNGLVASTDNYSELCAGFWTLHGDVGDLSPIQALLKSWEVPYISMISGVPESTYRATPTDGLGISDGDEAQLGASYLEWDLMVQAISFHGSGLVQAEIDQMGDTQAAIVYENVMKRMGGNWFKRQNPINLKPAHIDDRYAALDRMDDMFRPSCIK